MGQCESTLPGGDNKNGSPLGCHAGLPLQHILPGAQSSSSSSSSATFLKTHQPDRQQKCILDPLEVDKVLHYQADEMLSQEGLSPDNVDDEYLVSGNTFLLSEDGGDSRIPDFVSDIAPSEMTTWSTATRPAGNVGGVRPSFKSSSSSSRRRHNAFSVMENLNGVPPPRPPRVTTVDSIESTSHDDEIAYYTRHNKNNHNKYQQIPHRTTVNGGSSSSLSIQSSMKLANKNLRNMMPTRTNNPSSSRIIGAAAEEEAKQETRSGNVFFDVYENLLYPWTTPKDEVLQRREQYMSALQIKMKAHLGYYYTQRFLPLFPDAPSPIGLSKADIYNNNNKDRAPSLVDDSSSSSSSANSQGIDYGVPPATQVKSSITDCPFMDLAITGSLGLVSRHGHTTTRRHKNNNNNNTNSHTNNPKKSPDHYIVLMNQRSGVPYAVCALKSVKGNPVVRMFATKRRVPGQRAAAFTKQLGLGWAGNFPLYAWAEIVTDGMYPDPVSFSIFMASGSEGRFSAIPCYKANLDASEGWPTIKVVGRTDKEVTASGCAIIDVAVDEENVNNNNNHNNHNNNVNNHTTSSSSSKESDLVFQMKIAQGIDPALMICFAAVIDEVMEKSMRLQARYGDPRRRRS